MVTNRTVAVVVGSLRKDSINRKLGKALADLAPKNLSFDFTDIAPLQLYNQDLDVTSTPEWTAFRAQIKKADAVLFLTPEYNRSVPGVLQNAIDVGSRPYGLSVWSKKPAAVVSASIGGIGGFGANHHLRQSLMFLDMPTMNQPEAYIHVGSNFFDAQGKIADEKTRGFVQTIANTFAVWIEKTIS
jgi:chromate reductase, NAD(P)H dehydrogenase (quinone)